MPLLRLSRKIARAEPVTRADLLDIPVERVIAEGRLVLCALSLFAAYLDPTQPAHFAPATFGILLGYSAFALAMLAIVLFRPIGRPLAGYLIHSYDIVMISVLTFLSMGPGSPFLAFFIFVLFAATLRWNWQHVVATGALLLSVLVVATIALAVAPHQVGADAFDLNNAIIRAGNLLVVGAMLAYVSAFRARRREGLAKLAQWPGRDMSQEDHPALATILGYAAGVLDAPRILVIWEEAEEPFLNVALWQDGNYRQTREAAGTFAPLTRAEHARVFLTTGAESKLVITPEGWANVAAPIIDLELMSRFKISSVATAPFSGTLCRGRLFVLDRGSWNDDHLPLTEILASRIGIELDQQALERRIEETAATRERMRLTRDLHDGILQSLTAAGLQLKLLAHAPRELQPRLAAAKQLLEDERRRIRDFVTETLPKSARRNVFAKAEFQQLLAETARNWRCEIAFALLPEDAAVPASVGIQLSFMFTEAVANAVRHGGASKIEVAVEKTGADLRIKIRDNGRGFGPPPVQAERGELVALERTPVSLRARVGDLGGSLAVASPATGAELDIRVPLP